MELVDVDSCNGIWERCIYDGGRDYYSKMTTLPMFPQFARFIPSYLDHSPSSLSVSTPPAPEIDLKGQGITIVDITKKEVDEAMMDLFDENEEGVDDGQKDYQEEDLDVLFPNHRDSQVSAASAKLDDSERTDNGADATNDDNVTERGDSPSIKPTDSMNALEHSNFHFASSSFSFPPDSSSLVSMGRGVKLCGGMMEEYYSSCLHVKPDCSRKCIVMLTETHLILEFEDGDGIVEGENESHQKKLRDSLHEDKLQEHDQMVLMEKHYVQRRCVGTYQKHHTFIYDVIDSEILRWRSSLFHQQARRPAALHSWLVRDLCLLTLDQAHGVTQEEMTQPTQ
jgi:hypothetical protein